MKSWTSYLCNKMTRSKSLMNQTIWIHWSLFIHLVYKQNDYERCNTISFFWYTFNIVCTKHCFHLKRTLKRFFFTIRHNRRLHFTCIFLFFLSLNLNTPQCFFFKICYLRNCLEHLTNTKSSYVFDDLVQAE